MIRKAAIVLMAVTLPACGGTRGPERVVEPRNGTAPAARGGALLRQIMLARHNDARRAVDVAPLAWDDTLAAHALDYARELARTRRFQHAPQPMGAGREGENLFTGTRDAYSFAEMIQYWIGERKWFVDRPAPDFSTTGNGEAVAHYTQIVWRTSTRVGCAIASNDRDDYLVCRYAPPGNVIGLTAL